MNPEKLISKTIPIKGSFVVLSLETTGLRPDVDKIIAVSLKTITNGKLQLSWDRLINPGISIPAHIQKTTGITNTMVKSAPCFSEVANELYEILKNKILIAHHARFSYGFLKNQLLECGITLDEKILCTLRLSRLFFPHEKDHSLTALQTRFELTTQNHVKTLLAFLGKLQELVTLNDLKNVFELLIKYPTTQGPLSLKHLKNIPNSHGIYQFYGENNALLYVRKSSSLRECIFSHFKNDHQSHKNIQLAQQVKRIAWIETAGELGAALLEATFIKKHKAIFNQLMGRKKSFFTIQIVANDNDFQCLQVVNLAQVTHHEINQVFGVFPQKSTADQKLKTLIKDNTLCFHINNFEKIKDEACFRYQLNKCNGACGKKEAPEEYNSRVHSALKEIGDNPWPYKGKIAIKEINSKKSDHVEYHIIDKWCYLDSVTELDNLDIKNQSNQTIDVDIYHIVTQFLMKKSQQLEIIELV
ncbi:MAG: exonuclease domain-containing protein [Gammaproteobacteria bacterium]